MTRLIAAALAVTLCACGGDDGGADGGIPDGATVDAATLDAATLDATTPDAAGSDAAMPDAGAMPATELDALCAPDGPVVTALHKIFQCGESGRLAPLIDEEALSGERLERVCRNDFDGYLADGTVTVDEEAIDGCLAWLETVPCEVLSLDGFRPVFSVTPCDAVIVGTLASEGGCEIPEECGCERSLQCAGDAYCKQMVPGACGECTARLADGESCTSDDECSSGTCNQAGVCAAPGQAGDACTGDDDCQGELNCSTITSECESPYPREGNPCTTQADCGADDVPVLGLYCDVDGTGTCTALPEPGEPCLTGIGPHETLCDPANYEWCSPVDGLCKEPLVSGEGEPCTIYPIDDSGARRCADGLACTSPFGRPGGPPIGVCYTPRTVGQSCGMKPGYIDRCEFLLLGCLGGACRLPDTGYTGVCAGVIDPPCVPITTDDSAIGFNCISAADCPESYTCQLSLDGVVSRSCQIVCTEDCECPAGHTCEPHSDDSGTWMQCDPT